MFIGSSIALFLAVILLFVGFASSLSATPQQQTTTTPLLPPPPPSSSSSGTTTGQTTSPPLTSPPSTTTSTTTVPQPLTPQEQEQLNRLQNVIAATNQNLDETEKQIGGIVYTPRWSDPVWVEPDSASVLVAYCLPGEFAESGQEILGGFELEVLESYEVALPQNFTAWMMVIGNEDRQNRYPAAVGVICASDANNVETRVVSPQEQQQINNVVQQFTQVTSIDQVINVINNNNNNSTNQNTTTTTPPSSPPAGGSSGSSGVGGITISDLDIEFLPSDLTGVDVRAEISANTYNGPCPVTAEISGTITDNVGNRDVTYRVIGSHGGVLGEAPIHFNQPGSQSFSTKFTPTLGEGWAAIEILQPIDANLLQSNKAEFQIICAPSTGGAPAAPQTLQAENTTTATTDDDDDEDDTTDGAAPTDGGGAAGLPEAEGGGGGDGIEGGGDAGAGGGGDQSPPAGTTPPDGAGGGGGGDGTDGSTDDDDAEPQ